MQSFSPAGKICVQFDFLQSDVLNVGVSRIEAVTESGQMGSVIRLKQFLEVRYPLLKFFFFFFYLALTQAALFNLLYSQGHLSNCFSKLLFYKKKFNFFFLLFLAHCLFPTSLMTNPGLKMASTIQRLLSFCL